MKLKSNGSVIKKNFKTNKNYRNNLNISREIISTNLNKTKFFVYLKNTEGKSECVSANFQSVITTSGNKLFKKKAKLTKGSIVKLKLNFKKNFEEKDFNLTSNEIKAKQISKTGSNTYYILKNE